jgi:ABC-type transport system involved in cytochrome c biogenesis permease subunit
MGFAHGSSLLDPQITPLVPVLKSYWLMIHVAIITSSYAFFGLGALLSVFSLILYTASKSKYTQLVIKELTIVNELSLTVGIINLTIGTFLGGIWANESWGRYWSWDPKETWAFISVIVYAFVLHLRLIPALKNFWVFNVVSMWAISSVIMTYFGVNYYLSGLHSYAAGDPIPIPNWVYIATTFGAFLSIFSYFGYKNKTV